ncbi:non-ribosomal peptide synthase/polyketide synthase [Pseudoalteromonas sp. MMG005]|uniref:non-ribosomal peptide synthase/polyketide synthase n=1 Tax=Pseudoalteromonas sp. MMG005 TaxID=2822682 RepID=UPI001B3A167D|nr:non-ribosomal peptide synthase/polyketide synthase [Pseudoalteromonas sp. MMG005]MBQ4844738.1 non-ribosomal peptide synthase/polyketide synthase [Pseudoalteromonas sp. MMG005]
MYGQQHKPKKHVPLSFTQSDIYLDQQQYVNHPLYNVGGYIKLSTVDEKCLQVAHERLVNNHEIFGLRICNSEAGLSQYFCDNRPSRFEVLDFSQHQEPLNSAKRWLETRFSLAFELNEQPLYNAYLVKINENLNWYVAIAHHVMMDGWGFANWANLLSHYYRDDTASLQVDSGEWTEVVDKDRRYVESHKYDADKEFWLRQGIKSLPRLFSRTHMAIWGEQQLVPSKRTQVTISEELRLVLTARAKAWDISIAQLVLAGVSIYFSRVYQQSELNVGLSFHSRNGAKQKRMLGAFTSISPATLGCSSQQALLDFVIYIANVQKKCFRHQRFPFGHLIKALGVSGKDNQLFDIAFNYLKLDSQLNFEDGKETLEYVSHQHEVTPVTITYWEYGDKQLPTLMLDHNLAYFNESEADLLLQRLLVVLKDVALRDDMTMISELEILCSQDYSKIATSTQALDEANINSDVLLHHQISHYATDYPEHTAVIAGEREISYSELEYNADVMAQCLLAKGVCKQDRVLVYQQRDIALIVAILAIAKVGGVYVPCDMAVPLPRLQAMAEDARPKVCLTDTNGALNIENGDGLICEIINCEQLDLKQYNYRGVKVEVSPDDLIYLMYTSGSTGKPKGVMIEHRQLSSFILPLQQKYQLDVGKRFLQFASVSFDTAIEEIFAALVHGVTLVLRSEAWLGSAQIFWHYCDQYQINLLSLPTAFWHRLVVEHQCRVPHCVELIILGGEALATDKVATWFGAEHRNPPLINSYGPTETTVSASCFYIDDTVDIRAGIPIGIADPNTQLYILNDAKQPVPFGVPGEIYIGGSKVARGYWQRPDLTEQAFFRDPWSKHPDARMYKTGDIGRFRSDGNIEFLGRNNSQVKIRGHRIELGEIEHHICQVHGVDSAIVVHIKSPAGESYLHAYIKPLGDLAENLIHQVKQGLVKQLPSYMQPAAFKLVVQWPLSANGKVDRKALPDIEVDHRDKNNTKMDANELFLAELWAKLLELPVSGMTPSSDFFALGGHSLLAINMLSEIKRTHQIDISLSTLFSASTLAMLAEQIRTGTALATNSIIQAIPQADSYPMSLAQLRLWTLDQLQGDSRAYNMLAAFEFSGSLNITCFNQALAYMVKRHEILRTNIVKIAQSPVQVCQAQPNSDSRVLDYTHLSMNDYRVKQQTYIQHQQDHSFDLEKDMLLIASVLVRRSLSAEIAQEGTLVIKLHHIIADGWSVEVFCRELSLAYHAFLSSKEPPLAPLLIQYRDYAYWQEQQEINGELTAQYQYWQQQLADVTNVEHLTVSKREARRGQQGIYSSVLPDTLQKPLIKSLNDSQLTPFMFVHGALALLLSRHGNCKDVFVGTAVANRLVEQTKSLIGFFVNTLVLRTTVANQPVIDYLEHIKLVNQQAQVNQEAAYEQLVERLGGDSERNLFQVMLTQIQGFGQGKGPEHFALDGVTLSLQQPYSSQAKYDLQLEFHYMDGALSLTWLYDEHCFDDTYIKTLDQHFWHILTGVINRVDSDETINHLPMLSQSDQDYLVHTLNKRTIEYPKTLNVNQRFESIVEQFSENVALVSDNKSYRFDDLNRRANRLAHFLLEHHHITPGMCIGLCTSRSLEMVVAMLAILKVGGAYVPLDGNQPQQRLANIVADADLKLIVTDQVDEPRFTMSQGCELVLNKQFFHQLCELQYSDENLSLPGSSDQLAYVIYTSGSTGKPKGVLTPHLGIIRLVCDVDYVELNSQTRTLHCASVAFDAATFEIWGPLLNGGSCVMYTRPLVTLESINELLVQWQVNTLWLTAGLFAQWTRQLPQKHALKQVLAGGDVLDIAAVNQFKTTFPNVQLLNGYGPTENTTFTTCHLITEATLDAIPIGRALAGDHVYILQGEQLAPFGAVGELCVGGDGLAKGYLNEPQLTRERFVVNPLYQKGSSTPKVIYRTGDLVRYQASGVMVFVGRADQQVKIRGFRIELDEIRNYVNQHEAIASSLVVIQAKGEDKRIVAYVQFKGVVKHDSLDEVKRFLAQQLPSYMLPQIWITLESWPLTHNGKIDHTQLPSPNHEQKSTLLPPVTTTEADIAKLWAETLDIDVHEIGCDSNFFGLGGHSLSLIKMASVLTEYFKVAIPAAEVYQQATLKLLAQLVDEQIANQSKVPVIEHLNRVGPSVLSYAQQRLWFIEQMQPGSEHYVMSSALQLKGKIDAAYIEQALQAIIARHDILRSRFITCDGAPRQEVLESSVFTLRQHDLTHKDAKTQEAHLTILRESEARRGFDLQAGGLIRASLVQCEAEAAVLLISMHHIIADGWSVEVLHQEFTEYYQALRGVTKATLAPLSIQYADYAQWQQQYQDKQALQASLDYWLAQLENLPQRHDLPCDAPRTVEQSLLCQQHTIDISAYQAQKLTDFAQQQNMTLFMLLHGALGILLSRHSNNNDIVIGSPVANRLSPQLAPLIGCFINNLVLRLNCEGTQSIAEYFNQVKRVNQDAQAHQATPFEWLVEQLQSERNQAHAPLFQIMLNLHSQRKTSLDLANVEVSECEPDTLYSEYDLTFNVFWEEQGLVVNLIYNTARFSVERIATLARHFTHILDKLVAMPAQMKLGQLALLNTTEQAHVIAQGQGPKQEIPAQSVLALLRDTGAQYSAVTAVRCLEQTIDYQALYRQAQQIAYGLQQAGVEAGDLVGVCLLRSTALLPALLGVWQVGAAYVPLDPDYPRARLAHMIHDSELSLVLSEPALYERLPAEASLYDIAQCQQYPEALVQSCVDVSAATACAYVIYTSGSTGLPKGVAVSHHNVVNFLTAMAAQLRCGSETQLLAVTPISFDIHVLELYLPLLVGGTVHLADNAMRQDAVALVARLNQGDITMMQATPAGWKMLLSEGRWQPTSQLHILCGGEALDSSLSMALQGQGHTVWNLYGPTETTVWSAAQCVSGEVVNIGQPIANTQFYILNDSYQLQPKGSIGELYIGGDGVSCGYLGQDVLTAERFIDGISLGNNEGPLYRTGDLARQADNGAFDIVGRVDQQVKVRGHRIELSEIEQQLLSLVAIEEAVVQVIGENEQSRLVAYVVTTQSPSYCYSYVQEELGTHLPSYMIPQQVVVLPQLPLTPNGKVDRKSLPTPNSQKRIRVAPKTVNECKLVQICAQLLSLSEDEISLDQHFFELGGHSLLSVKLQAEIRTEFGVELALSDIFSQHNLHSLVVDIESQEQTEQVVISPREGNEPSVLSYAQQRLWFIEQMQPGSEHYVMSSALQLKGKIDAAYIEKALQAIIARHDILRSRFITCDGAPRQEVLESSVFTLRQHDLTHKDAKTQEAHLTILRESEARRGFDLQAGGLIRASLVQCEAEAAVLLISMHHIIADGWSVEVLHQEFTEYYQALRGVTKATLAPLSIQYADYAQWQQQYQDKQALQASLDYWLAQLENLPQRHDLPCDAPRTVEQSLLCQQHTIDISAYQAQKLTDFAQQQNMTLFMLLHGALGILLSRHSNNNDIVIGSPVANRLSPQLAPLIGCFINNLVLRLNCEGTQSIAEYFNQVKRVNQDAQAHQATPFEWLVEQLQSERNQAHAPLFQIMLNLHSQRKTSLDLANVEVSECEPDTLYSEYDLTFNVFWEEQGLVVNLIYNTARFSVERIATLARHFTHILDKLVAMPAQMKLGQLALLNTTEQAHVIAQGQGPKQEIPAQSVLALLRDTGAQYSAVTAVRCLEQTIDYQALYRQAQQIAYGLQQAGVEAGDLVGVCLLRSTALLPALLGVWQVGAAYVPLDPDYPRARLAHMIHDSELSLVLSEPALYERLPAEASLYDIAQCQQYPEALVQSCVDVSAATACAYVIYTSGSTGLPKGVAVSHHNVVNFLTAMAAQLRCGSETQLLAVTPISFDIHVLELYLPLLVGGTVHLADNAMRQDAVALVARLNQGDITMMQATPAGWKMLLSEGRWQPTSQLHILCGGEALDSSLSMALQGQGHTVWNLYGPTETTVWSAAQCVSGEVVNIGQPIANTQFYILNDSYQLQPKGSIGELYIGGDGVSCGYLGQDVLTAERFIDGISLGNNEGPLYRTGDLARQADNGAFDIVGRVDQQVKVRGHRIELSEIEQQLLSLVAIEEAVVQVIGENEQSRLVAYVVTTQSPSYCYSYVQEELGTHLPSYMIPQQVVVLPQLPLTPNGKVDRKSLPTPNSQKRIRVAPKTVNECKLVQICAQLLSLSEDEISLDQHFFELGGHSLLSVKLQAEIRTEFGVELALSDIFSQHNLHSLVVDIESQEQTEQVVISPREGNEPSVLSYAQQRLWFIEQMQPGSEHYVMSSALQLKGKIDAAYIEKALQAIIARHDILRSRFITCDGAPRQEVLESSVFTLRQHDLTHKDAKTQEAHLTILRESEARRGFDLQAGGLIRASLVQCEAEAAVLLISMHHIIADGWSVEVLHQEFTEYYQALRGVTKATLAPLSIQYADYAQWQQQYQDKQALQASLDYWLAQLENLPQRHDLPCDAPRTVEQSLLCQQHTIDISAYQAQKLTDFAQQQNMTLFMLLHGALGILLSRHSNNNDIVIGSPVANRLSPQLAPLIGCFINNLVLRLNCEGTQSIAEYFNQVKRVNQDAQAHQATPFEWLVEQLQSERNQAHAPLFQIMLNLHSQRKTSLDLANVEVSECEPDTLYSEYDLTFNVFWEEQGLVVNLIYNTARFSVERIATLARHFTHILDKLVAMPAQMKLGQLALLNTTEQAHVIAQGQGPKQEIPAQSVLALLRDTGAQYSAVTAVRCLEQTIDYQALYRQAQQIAYGLQQAGVEAGDLVGVCLLRSTALLPALLGVWQVGAAYVPLDPDYPRARLAHMIHDSELSLVLSEPALYERLPAEASLYDIAQCQQYPEALVQSCVDVSAATACAYVIYTSGSTGLPKGVAVSHHNVVNFLTAMAAQLRCGSETQLLAVTPISFDIHVLELYLPLLVGGTVHLADNAMRQDAVALVARLNQGDITMMQATPAGWKMLLSEGRWQPTSQLHILCGGEALDSSLSMALQGQGHTVWNLYGPTETTVWSAAQCVSGEVVNIGQPIANTQFYILNDSYQLQPKGSIGELYIGGDGVSCGYLGQDVLTAERFIDGISLGNNEGPLYRTGDLARQADNGAFDIVGRVDQQVKVRGHRIELSEIEQQLLSLVAIEEAVVQVIGENEQSRLVAYVVTTQSPSYCYSYVQEELGTHLPSYMIPQQVVVLPQLPLTPNGKVDRKSLPTPNSQKRIRVAPKTVNECKLVQICAQLLSLSEDEISLDQHFFELGGHSLLSVKLQAEIRTEFGVELALSDIFSQHNLHSLVVDIESQEQTEQVVISPREGNEPSVLSYAQQRLWFIEQMQPGSEHYVMSSALQLKGKIDAAYIEKALQAIIARHDILRSRFITCDGAPRQEVLESSVFTLRQHDLTHKDAKTQEAHLTILRESEARRGFDLQAGGLIRASLVQCEAEAAVLLISMHHIIADGWSVEVLHQEFTEYYQALRSATKATLAPLSIQYADYAQWQQQYQDKQALQASLDYWSETLKVRGEDLKLPTDVARSAKVAGTTSREHFTLEPSMYFDLKQTAQRHGVTLNMLLSAAWAILLSKLSDNETIQIGIPVAGRDNRACFDLIGLFVNTVVLKVDVTPTLTLSELFSQVSDTSTKAFAHQNAPLEQVIERLNPDRNLNQHPVFQTLVALHYAYEATQLPDLHITELARTGGRSEFDISLIVDETHTGLNCTIEFLDELYASCAVKQWRDYFLNVLEYCTEDANVTLAELSLLSPAQEQHVLSTYHRPVQNNLAPLLHEQLTCIALRYPERIALIEGERALSYDWLETKSNQLAHHLLSKGVQSEDRIAICLPRTPMFMVAIFAIMKAGAAYVPIDITQPDIRLRYTLEDCDPALLLLNEEAELSRYIYPEKLYQVLRLNENNVLFDSELGQAPAINIGRRQLAYIMYTSGSTGNPKGVMIEHQQLVNFTSGHVDRYQLKNGMRILQFSAVSFDISIEDVFGTFSTGATLVLRDDTWLTDTAGFWALCAQYQINLVSLPTAFFHQLMQVPTQSVPSTLQTVIVGGEGLQLHSVNQWFTQQGKLPQLTNTYGPTETTVTVSHLIVEKDKDYGELLSIGQADGNNRIYILDEQQRLQAPGIKGEIYIGGTQVGRGYWRKNELTTAAFLSDPWCQSEAGKLYKTGDMARYRSDGNIEFLGRRDAQVKFKGFRIELTEIELRLALHDRLDGAVVKVDESQQHLDAWLINKEGGDTEALVDEIKAWLKSQLPNYMQPSRWAVLKVLPLTNNGKIDKANLPSPIASSGSRYVAPSNEIEVELVDLLQLTLGLHEPPGIHDNFFELGGSSISLIAFKNAIEAHFVTQLELLFLFTYPTVAEIALAIELAQKNNSLDNAFELEEDMESGEF